MTTATTSIGRTIRLPRWTLLLRRLGWIVYAIALLLATHWPGVQIDGPVPRTDLWMHLGALGAWTVGLAMTAWPGQMLERASIVRTAAIAAPYAVLSELSQGLPFIHRVMAWEDAAANLAGAALGVVALSLAALLARTANVRLVDSLRP